MQAFRILLHALRLVFGNLGQALVMSALPLVVALGAMVAIGIAGRFWADGIRITGLVSLVAAMLVFAATLVWFAVRWHRFILLDERQQLLALPPAKALMRYIGVSFLTFLMLVPVGIAVMMSVYAAYEGGGSVVSLIVGMVLVFLLYVLALILAAALPGAAIGAGRPIRAAWRALKPAAGTILLLTLLGFVGYEITEAAFFAFVAIGVPLALAILLTAVAYWLSTLISLSVLTTLWGHYVEGRPLR